MDDHNTPAPRGPLTSTGFTRRTALRTAAWSAPVVSIAVAAPAFAASLPTTPTLSVSFNPDSFRANSNAELTAGTPSQGTFAPLAMVVAVAGGAVTDLKCMLVTSGNGASVANNTVQPARGGTTWAVGSGDLAAAGFASTPAVGAAQANAIAFTKAGSTAVGSVNFKLVMASLGSTDFPLVFTFSATGTASTTTVTVTSPATSPFIAATIA